MRRGSLFGLFGSIQVLKGGELACVLFLVVNKSADGRSVSFAQQPSTSRRGFSCRRRSIPATPECPSFSSSATPYAETPATPIAHFSLQLCYCCSCRFFGPSFPLHLVPLQFVTPFVHANTRAKVVVCGANFLDKMAEHIDLDQVPTVRAPFLGAFLACLPPYFAMLAPCPFNYELRNVAFCCVVPLAAADCRTNVSRNTRKKISAAATRCIR